MSNGSRPLVVQQAFILLGQATRLPGKFWLPVGRETILEREIRTLRSVGLEVTVVSVAPVNVPEVTVLRDRLNAGPLGGLATVLAETHEPIFLFGGDMPLLDPRGIETMKSRFDGRTMVPIGPEGRWEVLHAIYAGVRASAVATHLQRGGGLRDLVAELDRAGEILFVGPGAIDARSFTDIDAPEDLARLQRRVGSVPP